MSLACLNTAGIFWAGLFAAVAVTSVAQAWRDKKR